MEQIITKRLKKKPTQLTEKRVREIAREEIEKWQTKVAKIVQF